MNGAGQSKADSIVEIQKVNPVALRIAKIIHNFGLSECNRVKSEILASDMIIHGIKMYFFYFAAYFFAITYNIFCGSYK